MNKISVFNEIGKLEKVLLHRPSKELLNLTPDTLEELLFDDIPYLKVAAIEHDYFSEILRREGAEVVYLEDLMAEVIKDAKVKEDFIYQYIKEGNIKKEKMTRLIFDYLSSFKDEKDLILKTMEGIHTYDVDFEAGNSLLGLINAKAKMIIPPMPNLYFTRDPFAVIGNGVAINHMHSKTRRRETIYAEYIFKYHKDYKDVDQHYYDRYSEFSIEGGDILNLSESALAVGISERTEAMAVDILASNIFQDEKSPIDTILAIKIPNTRASMHLDTVFTQIDHDKFSIHPGIFNTLEVYELKKGERVKRCDDDLDKILAKVLKVPSVELIRCGGDDRIASEREQWNDGANTLCIRPGVIVVYERNYVTNELFKKRGIEVIEIPSSELSRGRGGPRCMSMPLVRAKI